MKSIKSFCTILALICVVVSQSLFAADGEEKLFVNLSSDELNIAAMAIGFSTNILTQKEIPVTLFLNVNSIRIVDKNIPEHKHANGKSLKEFLTDFIEAGGRVIVCPMCMKNVGGLNKDELLEGVEVGGPDVTWPALFAEGTTVLSF